jgi:hypothetical protein
MPDTKTDWPTVSRNITLTSLWPEVQYYQVIGLLEDVTGDK